jgi:CRISPR-associated protein Cmr6
MSIAAVPRYLGDNFQTASPGMRFGMYLPIWSNDWSKEKSVASFLKDKICPLGQNDIKTQDALIRRQKALAKIYNADTLFVIAAQSVAPFTTGLGNEHPLENGFAFLNPYGLPYLPGSGVKGVLRQAARELVSGQWGNPQDWNKEIIEILFGSDPEQELKRGVLSLWDVIPQIKGNHLAVDIMTPHQGHYYQNGENPHESGQPTPISFLTVPPQSDFTFYVRCDTVRLKKLAPDLMAEDDGKQRWCVLLERAFEHAFKWLGFGAKTAVGYGAMQKTGKKPPQTTPQTPQDPPKTWQGARIKFNHANGALTVEKDGKTAIALAPRGEELLKTLPVGIQQKIRSNAFVKISAQVSEGNVINIEV